VSKRGGSKRSVCCRRGICSSLLVLAALVAAAAGQGWVGQQNICRPDSFGAYEPFIAVDGSGTPWVVWMRKTYDSTLAYARWIGDHWDDARAVGMDAPGVYYRTLPSLAFDQRGRAWLAWCNLYDNDDNRIASSFWADTSWSPEIQVSQLDSNLYFAPWIACGGGRIWCVWYGGPTDTSPYSVYASRWDDSSRSWIPQMRVSPPDGNLHWFCNVAVDSLGRPHVFWGEFPHHLIYYSFYSNSVWSRPFVVNDTTLVKAANYAEVHAVIDCDGNLQVCYVGVAAGADERDVFYVRRDKYGWSPSLRVNAYGQYTAWTASIAVNRPDNIWVAWDGQGSWPDQFRIFASHYDGTGWSPEERLDNDSAAYNDGGSRVALNAGGNPLVVWSGVGYESRQDEAFYNRYGTASVCERPRDNELAGRRLSVSVSNPCTRTARVLYALESPSPVELSIFDGTGRYLKTLAKSSEPAGQHVLEWACRTASGQKASPGVYFCRLKAGSAEATAKIILIGQ